jgi:hypothetical protein
MFQRRSNVWKKSNFYVSWSFDSFEPARGEQYVLISISNYPTRVVSCCMLVRKAILCEWGGSSDLYITSQGYPERTSRVGC